MRIGLELLRLASDEDVRDLAESNGWGELAATDAHPAERNLGATYLIRMYSVFERAVTSSWRQAGGGPDRCLDGDVLLDEVGFAMMIDDQVVRSARAVRGHRNRLVHRRIEDHAGEMTVEDAVRDLFAYLDRLPATWN